MAAAFIVDGATEKKIVQALCQDSPVRMTGLNGRDAAITALAKAIQAFIKLFKGRYYPVIIVVDRETRDMTSEEMEAQLVHELQSYGIDTAHIIMTCPDRMIENWMLADKELMQGYGIEIDDVLDGCNGKAKLRSLLREKEITYHELTVGVDIFRKADPNIMSRNSASFARFQGRAAPFCQWLRPVR
jgi:hypothetical protein